MGNHRIIKFRHNPNTVGNNNIGIVVAGEHNGGKLHFPMSMTMDSSNNM